jgi:hypothetical protein
MVQTEDKGHTLKWTQIQHNPLHSPHKNVFKNESNLSSEI